MTEGPPDILAGRLFVARQGKGFYRRARAMSVDMDLEPVPDMPALRVKGAGGWMVVADLHVGIEAQLRRSGFNLPSQMPKMTAALESLSGKARNLMILGDLKQLVEIFLDPACLGKHYAEVEISPINIVTDLHILEPHPRLNGDRSWNWRGLESTVVPGSCGGLTPGSWVALAWLPWSGLGSLGAEVAARVPPSAGDAWRFNVFRIKRPHGPSEPERDAVYAAWSAPDGPSFHEPAAFRRMEFSPA